MSDTIRDALDVLASIPADMPDGESYDTSDALAALSRLEAERDELKLKLHGSEIREEANDHRADQDEERSRHLVEALREVHNDLNLAHAEAWHGLTATNQFIDNCVKRAIAVTSRELVAMTAQAVDRTLEGERR